MNFKNILITICVTVLSLTSYIAKAVDMTDSVKISGHLSEDCINQTVKGDELFITLYNHLNEEDPSNAIIIPVKLHKGYFSSTFKLRGKVGYFNLMKSGIKSINDGYFLIQAGDSINIEVRSLQDVSFYGRGAEKLNYQHWAFKLLYLDIKNWGTEDKWADIMAVNKKRVNKILAIALDSLMKDKKIEESNIKDIIRLNMTSAINFDYLEKIYSFFDLKDEGYFNYIKDEINYQIIQQNALQPSDPFIIKNAPVYINYLFYLNSLVATIKTLKGRAPFEIVYNNLKGEYNGPIRDEILPYCFLKMLKRNPEAISKVNEAISLISDPDDKVIIENVRDSKSIGAKAFNFDFETSNKSRIKRDDFRGKIVVLETYYNGCIYCVQLSKAMESVMEHFKYRNDIVYISFDGVAKKFKDFQKGVESGLYGKRISLYAWTGGLGETHPFLSYYKYTAFPNILIIGKQGQVVAADPARPLDAATRKSFIELIEKNL